jgi:hypothetical protein
MFVPTCVSAGCTARANQSIREQQEMTLVSDLGDNATSPMDELRVFVVWLAPGE